jgi:hypothetical protein
LSDALARLRERNRHDVELPSGLKVTLRLPHLEDCIIAGDIPLAILSKLDKGEEGSSEMTTEELKQARKFNLQVVADSVIAIDAEDVELTADDAREFEPQDFREILSIATREKDPSGKA